MLTRDFNVTLQARMQADPPFRDAVLREGIEAMLNGDVETARILSNYSVLNSLSARTTSSVLSAKADKPS